MGNYSSLLRCCLACVLPCGALDLIRIVHLNGSVDELTGRVTAGEVLANHPNHLLTKPCSGGSHAARRILILSPETDLKKGSIYFLIPASSLPAEKTAKILRKFSAARKSPSPENIETKASSSRRRRRSSTATAGRRRLWRPNLDSIFED
ncbi:uncharacterized protein LOC127253814 [Andrographis paniculata]|uniref:uncharacterized protein LOC127253814 n=1 Tax=Andrographis paniculata TaxID=175694 RepID=UPI0021E804DA|nr:uncharacterized protein LOC127253814 [Andrographis paniculata]